MLGSSALRNALGWVPQDMPDLGDVTGEKNAPDTLRRAITMTATMAAIILVARFVLARVGDTLVAQSGLGGSFIGATLLDWPHPCRKHRRWSQP